MIFLPLPPCLRADRVFAANYVLRAAALIALTAFASPQPRRSDQPS